MEGFSEASEDGSVADVSVDAAGDSFSVVGAVASEAGSRVAEALSFEALSFEALSFEALSFEVSSFEVLSFEVSSFEVSSFEVSSFEVSSLEVSSFEASSFEASVLEELLETWLAELQPEKMTDAMSKSVAIDRYRRCS